MDVITYITPGKSQQKFLGKVGSEKKIVLIRFFIVKSEHVSNI